MLSSSSSRNRERPYDAEMPLHRLVPPPARRVYHHFRPRLRLLGSDDWVSVYDVRIGRRHLRLSEPAEAKGLQIIAAEIDEGPYDFSNITFDTGDVVLDLGAHVGAISTFLAITHPHIRIIAYEPLPPLFACLERNLADNGANNVTAVNIAVTSDGRQLDLIAYIEANSGGATANIPARYRQGAQHFSVPSTTLDECFERHSIERCHLLKIDIEGSEHEVLMNASCLDRVDRIRGEFHQNSHLNAAGYSIDRLLEHCSRYVAPHNIEITRCAMWEGG
jgi:FkbM family methyltransferase